MTPREFMVALLDEIIISIKDDKNYASKYQFDKNVFQKFIAVMFVNYATTDPMFYGSNFSNHIRKRISEVTVEPDLEDTPLYRAIARQLREIEAQIS